MKFAAAQQQAQGEDPFGGLSQKNMDDQVKAIERLLNEADQITVGWKLDRTAKNTFLDFTLPPFPARRSIKTCSSWPMRRRNFSGFTPPDCCSDDELRRQNVGGKHRASDHHARTVEDQNRTGIDNDTNLPEDKARDPGQDGARQLIDVIEKTVRSGKSDGGGLVVAGPNKLQAAVGGFVADGAGLETAVKNLVKLAKGDAEFNALPR